MKRWIVASIGLLITLALMSPVWADSYTHGVALYKQGRYAQAISVLNQAIQENGNNPLSMFYLGLAYSKQGNLSAARSAFENVIQMTADTDPLAKKARNNITALTNNQIVNVSSAAKASTVMKAVASNNGNNYLSSVIPNGQIIRFNEKSMPLRVYIADGRNVPGWIPSMKSIATGAMASWQRVTGNKLRFVTVGREAEAHIVVRWQREFKDNIVGVSPLQTVGNTIVQSDVTLALYYPGSNQMIPMADMQGIAIHEFGHAIGLRGHSPYPQDIMYFSMNQQQRNTLSQRDINTINALYKIAADVKNSDMSAQNTQSYYQLCDLAIKANQAKQTERAIAYYRQAIRLSNSQPEAKYNLAVTLYNLGLTQAKGGNLAPAQRNFEEAQSLFQSVVASGNPPSGISSQTVNDLVSSTQNNLKVVKAMRAQGG